MAPFKSEAQRRKFIELEKQGKLKTGTVAKWNSETTKQIPERVKPSKIHNTVESLKKTYNKRFGGK
jgi:hypothetical protein